MTIDLTDSGRSPGSRPAFRADVEGNSDVALPTTASAVITSRILTFSTVEVAMPVKWFVWLLRPP
jgi:hypothetical protein